MVACWFAQLAGLGRLLSSGRAQLAHLIVRQMSHPPPISAKPEHTNSSSEAATMRGVQAKVTSGGDAVSGAAVPSAAGAASAVTRGGS